MAESRFLFKIELLEIKPTIWRRFFVPPDTTMEGLHHVVQIVMGWDGGHLWEFTAGERRFTPVTDLVDDFFDDDADDLDPAAYSLRDVVSKKGQVIRYLYDFGDSWAHKLKLADSNYLLPEGDGRKAGCLEGARACPPEDIGGAWGYADFCKLMTKPGSKRYKEMLEWYAGDSGGTPYDPERFDVDKVNKRLQRL